MHICMYDHHIRLVINSIRRLVSRASAFGAGGSHGGSRTLQRWVEIHHGHHLDVFHRRTLLEAMFLLLDLLVTRREIGEKSIERW